jgi:predicted metal-dependent enzyme (double-stranded beta helix superfamily)
MTTLILPREHELREISDLPTEVALRRAVPFVQDLAEDPALLEIEIPSLLEESQRAENWYVASRHENDCYSLQILVWPAGTGTRVHDHSSWGVYRCVVGSLLERRYTRLDDGSRPDHARLEKAWQHRWTLQDGASTVLPGDGGIHSMTNLGDKTAVSVHLYGPRAAEIDGRDYDPSRDYVCDRMEDLEEAGGQPKAA